MRREKSKPPSEAYLEKAQALPAKDAKPLIQLALGRVARRKEDKTKSPTEILALHMEYEDKQLMQWRNRLANMRKVENTTTSNSHQQS